MCHDAEFDDFLADVLGLNQQKITRVHNCVGIDLEDLSLRQPPNNTSDRVTGREE